MKMSSFILGITVNLVCPSLQVVTCSGAGKDGSLRVVRSGVGIEEQVAFFPPFNFFLYFLILNLNCVCVCVFCVCVCIIKEKNVVTTYHALHHCQLLGCQV